MDDKVKLPGEWMDDVFRKFCKDHNISILDLSKAIFILCQNFMFIYSKLVKEEDAKDFYKEHEKIAIMIHSILPFVHELSKNLDKVVPDDSR